ncbi:MAG: META domain-containing protein [Ardenticatenaceae bacterium]|nr:META domain-containing protein [Ardenticatenaceae bacterium]
MQIKNLLVKSRCLKVAFLIFLLYTVIFNRPLVGSEWILKAIDGKLAVSDPDGPEPSIRFLPFIYDGYTGCNRYELGLFVRFGQFVKLGNTGITERGCAEEVMEQETQMRRALVDAKRYYHLGDILYLITSDGTILEFER